jgi:hypothetical protein
LLAENGADRVSRGNTVFEALRYLRENGVKEAVRRGCHLHAPTVFDLLSTRSGTPVYSTPWDVLVVLDACRVDLLREVVDEYEFLPERIPSQYSLASTTDAWMRRNFTDRFTDRMRETVYVCGNPYSELYLEESGFLLLDEPWRDAWNETVSTVPARPITDRAVSLARELPSRRLIVHYMQPHFPSVPEPLDSGVTRDEWGRRGLPVWEDLREGRLDHDTVWAAYRSNLEYVLDDVALLLDNLEADTVVLTADHGNAFGEFGYYGHPPEHLPVLRRVPWVELSARDARTHDPETVSRESDEEIAVEQRLRNLGYLEE